MADSGGEVKFPRLLWGGINRKDPMSESNQENRVEKNCNN